MRPRRNAALGILALAAALTWILACEDTTGPVAGELTVRIEGPAAAAYLLTVTGDSIAEPVAANAGHRIDSHVSGRTMRAAVIGSVASGPLLRFSVPDVNKSGDYTVTLNEVAAADNTLEPTSAYTLTITK